MILQHHVLIQYEMQRNKAHMNFNSLLPKWSYKHIVQSRWLYHPSTELDHGTSYRPWDRNLGLGMVLPRKIISIGVDTKHLCDNLILQSIHRISHVNDHPLQNLDRPHNIFHMSEGSLIGPQDGNNTWPGGHLSYL